MSRPPITNGYINRRNQIPASDDSPGDTGDGGGIYQMGNGGGSNGGGSHNGDGGDEPEGGGNVIINRFGGKERIGAKNLYWSNQATSSYQHSAVRI